jgi:predicted Fe-Mo cluster-binding NifX family protein
MTDVMRIAVPTVGSRGMNDVVSSVFSKTPNFTFIEIVRGEVNVVEVEKNTASSLKQGSGPIVAKNLRDKCVGAVIVGKLGPGASTLLDLSGIKAIRVEPGIKISLALKKALKEL